MSVISRISEKESRRGMLKTAQLSMSTPIPVRIKEYFPIENMATIELINVSSGFEKRTGMEGLRFPVKGACHENIFKNLQPGTKCLLNYSGWQLGRGWLEVAHSSGLETTPTSAPIRSSWAVG